jgi:hypothetical protein
MLAPHEFGGIHLKFNRLKKVCCKECVKWCVASVIHNFFATLYKKKIFDNNFSLKNERVTTNDNWVIWKSNPLPTWNPLNTTKFVENFVIMFIPSATSIQKLFFIIICFILRCPTHYGLWYIWSYKPWYPALRFSMLSIHVTAFHQYLLAVTTNIASNIHIHLIYL